MWSSLVESRRSGRGRRPSLRTGGLSALGEDQQEQEQEQEQEGETEAKRGAGVAIGPGGGG